jgi:hypothetical protein
MILDVEPLVTPWRTASMRRPGRDDHDDAAARALAQVRASIASRTALVAGLVARGVIGICDEQVSAP